MSGPLLIVEHFRMPIGSSVMPKRRQELDGYPHTSRPDADNIEKFLNDALKGVLWGDDASISWLLRSKTKIDDPVGCYILFVKEIPDAKANFPALLADIAEHIDFTR